jgi:hypothetical protein
VIEVPRQCCVQTWELAGQYLTFGTTACRTCPLPETGCCATLVAGPLCRCGRDRASIMLPLQVAGRAATELNLPPVTSPESLASFRPASEEQMRSRSRAIATARA